MESVFQVSSSSSSSSCVGSILLSLQLIFIYHHYYSSLTEICIDTVAGIYPLEDLNLPPELYQLAVAYNQRRCGFQCHRDGTDKDKEKDKEEDDELESEDEDSEDEEEDGEEDEEDEEEDEDGEGQQEQEGVEDLEMDNSGLDVFRTRWLSY